MTLIARAASTRYHWRWPPHCPGGGAPSVVSACVGILSGPTLQLKPEPSGRIRSTIDT